MNIGKFNRRKFLKKVFFLIALMNNKRIKWNCKYCFWIFTYLFILNYWAKKKLFLLFFAVFFFLIITNIFQWNKISFLTKKKQISTFYHLNNFNGKYFHKNERLLNKNDERIGISWLDFFIKNIH